MVIRPRANGLDADTAFGVFAGPIGDERQPGKNFGSIIPRYRRAFVILGIMARHTWGEATELTRVMGIITGASEKGLMKNTV